MRTLFTAVALIAISGCASSPSTPPAASAPDSHSAQSTQATTSTALKKPNGFTPAPAAPEGYATLYIYGGYTDSGAAVWPIAFLDDVKVAAVKTQSYTYIYIWPGKYHLRIDKSFFLSQYNDEERSFDFVIPGTGTYYLQFGNGGATMMLPAGHAFVPISTGSYGWFLMPENVAQQGLQRTYYLPTYVQTVGHP